MVVKVLIPAKASSSRVPDKNWRPFDEDRCLVEVKLRQVLRTFAPEDVYVSCDDPRKRPVVERHGARFLLREPRLADDATIWADVVSGLVGAMPCDDEEEICWVECVA